MNTAGAYITLPNGCSLAERAPLPARTLVVLARSPYDFGAGTMHIAYWGLSTQALCSAPLVRTEAREVNHDAETGITSYRHLGRPESLRGRDDARFGYAAATTCDACRRRFAEMTRESLPHVIVQAMRAQRRADREARAVALAEIAAAAAAVEQLEAVEPVDLADVEQLERDVPAGLSGRTAESAAAPAPAPAATVERVPAAQLALIGEPLELAPPAPRPAPAADVVEADRSPHRRPDLHTDTLPLSDLSPYIGMGAFPDSRAPPPGRPTSTTRPAPPAPLSEGISRS